MPSGLLSVALVANPPSPPKPAKPLPATVITVPDDTGVAACAIDVAAAATIQAAIANPRRALSSRRLPITLRMRQPSDDPNPLREVTRTPTVDNPCSAT